MSRKFFQFLSVVLGVLVLSFLLGADPAHATGSFSGGGGDRVGKHKMQAWVTNGQELSWCINIDPNFGLGEDEAKKTIIQALEIWQKYLKGKNLTARSIEEPEYPTLLFYPVFHSTCLVNTSVTFYLGAENKQIDEDRKKFIDPAAFSKRLKYDREKMNGQGYVWIENGVQAPSQNGIQWKFRNNFLGLVLHEFGHILGCDHIPGTIMDENIVDIIRHTDLSQGIDESVEPLVRIVSNSDGNFTAEENTHFMSVRDILLSNVDFYNELFFLPDTGGSFFGIDRIKLEKGRTSRIAAGFERLIGKKIEHEVVATAVDFYSHIVEGMPGYALAQFKIAEAKQDHRKAWIAQEKEAWTFRILIEPPRREHLSSISPKTVFRRVGTKSVFEEMSPSVNRIATIVSREHKGHLESIKIPIVIQRNRGKFSRADAWDPYPVQMLFDEGEESSRLFFRSRIQELLVEGASSLYVPGGFGLPKGLSALDFLLPKPISE